MILLIALSSGTSAQTFTLWGTEHTYPGGPRTPCTIQHEIMTELAKTRPLQIQIPNFIYAEGESTPTQVKDHNFIISAGEDDNVHSYFSLYGATNLIVSQIFEAFSINQQNPEQEYWNNFQSYWDILFQTPHLKEATQEILANPKNHPYLKTIDGDLKAALAHSIPPTPEPGLLLYTERYFHGPVSDRPPLDQLKNILQAYLKLSADIGSSVFGNTLASSRVKYDMTITDPKSRFYQRKLFDFIKPSVLFTETYFLQSNRTQEQRDLEKIFKLDWRNKFVFENIVSIQKQYPNSNILLWIGQGHVPYLVWMIAHSKAFTDEQKDHMRVITNKTDPTLSCNLDLVLDTVRTGKGSTPLPDWQTKFGFN